MRPLRLLAVAFCGALPLLLAGCVQPPLAPPAATTAQSSWRGRLALRIDGTEPTSYFANFELGGQARAGELLLTSPMGTTLAELSWTPQAALLRGDGRTRTFDSLDALATEATGTDIPIAALFEWLQGRPAVADGWQADLSLLGEGRLVARRSQPAPAAELRLILEQP
jgi:outer membrane lipoprotein LolB